jgi:enterochelin esterase family protein
MLRSRALICFPAVLFACACTSDGTSSANVGTKDASAGGTPLASGTGGTPTGAGGNVASGGNVSAGGTSGGGTTSAGGAFAGGSAGRSGHRGAEAGTDAAPDTGPKLHDPGTEGDGDITISPPYNPHPDVLVKAASPHGKVYKFSLPSQGTLFDGMDKTLATQNQHAFTRDVRVYVPKQYVDGAAAPFMVVQDGDGFVTDVQNSLDNLIAEKKVPVMLAVFVNNGGNDGQDSERGLEYDTMSDRYSRFIDTNVLPAARLDPGIRTDYSNLRFSDDPDGRSSYGCSSGGAAALTQGWFTPDRYRRIVTYSGTFVDQQDGQGVKAPEEMQYPFGAWEYHSEPGLIANSPVKPLRVFLNASENDLQLDAQFNDMHHEWLVANQRTAAALKAKGYHYRFVYAKGVGHCDGNVRKATLPDTLEWMWRGYPID